MEANSPGPQTLDLQPPLWKNGPLGKAQLHDARGSPCQLLSSEDINISRQGTPGIVGKDKWKHAGKMIPEEIEIIQEIKDNILKVTNNLRET